MWHSQLLCRWMEELREERRRSGVEQRRGGVMHEGDENLPGASRETSLPLELLEQRSAAGAAQGSG